MNKKISSEETGHLLTRSNLLACPFCGYEHGQMFWIIIPNYGPTRDEYRWKCSKCGALGPHEPTGAATLWNKRTCMSKKKASTIRQKARSAPPHGSALVETPCCVCGQTIWWDCNPTLPPACATHSYEEVLDASGNDSPNDGVEPSGVENQWLSKGKQLWQTKMLDGVV